MPAGNVSSFSVGALLLISLFVISGCQQNISPQTYSVGSVGQANRAVRGVIISARNVDISGSQSGIGAGTGIATGAVVGSSAGQGARSNALGAIGGAVIGGIVGATLEEGATRQIGVEYVIETENKSLLTVVQGATPRLIVGEKVLVIYGTRSRVILDPSTN